MFPGTVIPSEVVDSHLVLPELSSAGFKAGLDLAWSWAADYVRAL